MNTILTIFGILLLGFVINVILKQAYNFIFFIGQKPVAWILVTAATSIAVWGVSAGFNWDVNIPAWACTMALLMNLPPSHNNSTDNDSATQQVDSFYKEMGVKHGRLLYRMGLASFAGTGVASWLFFYGETCAECL